MDMSVLDGGERLGCGMVVADLVEQVAAGDGAVRSAHQQWCPVCRQALDDLARWWAPVQRWSAEPIFLPAGLISRVMDRVDRLSGSTRVLVDPGERGVTEVTVWAVAAVAAQAAAGVAGVAAVLGWTARPAPRAGELGAGRPAAGGAVVVDVAIAVFAGIPIRAVSASVRRRVMVNLRALVGVEALEVSVSVEDVVDPDVIHRDGGSP
jgi:uncharacterized alkaline shock family protein YloU